MNNVLIDFKITVQGEGICGCGLLQSFSSDQFMFWPRLGPESGGITVTVNGTHLDKVSQVNILVKHPADSAQLWTAKARRSAQ